MMSHYYNLILNINSLINENKNEEAMKLINKELAMPYTPENIEKELIILLNKINIILMKEKINSAPALKRLSEIEIEENLKSGNYNIIGSTLQYLSIINIRTIFESIKKIFQSEIIDSDIKKNIIRICLDQDVKEKIKILFHGQEHTIDFSNLNWIENQTTYKKILKEIYDEIYSDSPQLYLIATNCLIKHFFKYWPFDIKEDSINRNNLKIKVINEAREYFK